MTDKGRIDRALCGSGAFHVALLVGAFWVYDPVELTLVHHEEARQMVLATTKLTPPQVKQEIESERPVVLRAPPPKKTPRSVIENRPEPVKPEIVQAPKSTPPSKKIRVAKRAGVQQIGAKSNAPNAKAAVATVADSRASDEPPSAPTAAAAAKRPTKATSKRLIREYYSTLSSYLRRNYAYPHRARLAAIEGTVLLEIVVDEEGNVIRRRVARSSGHEILDRAALASIAEVHSVPRPPSGLGWSRRAIRVPFRYTLRT